MTNLTLDNLTFDASQMSAKDIWDFEDKTDGLDLMEFAEQMKAGKITEADFIKYLKPIVALIWIVVRQQYPNVTFEEVAAHPMMSLVESLEVVKSQQPAQPLQPLASSKPAARSRKPKAAATS